MLGYEFKFESKLNYKDGEKIGYTITTSNNESIAFTAKLKKLQGELDYTQLSLNKIKEGIAVTGKIKETDNTLDLKLSSVIEGNGTNVIYYGEEHPTNEYETGIELEDSNGKIVKGKQVKYGDKFNHFEFNTTNLSKPYTITIPKVTVNISENIKYSNKIKLNLPQKGIVKVDKIVELYSKNYNNIKNNKAINITDIEKIDNNKYSINVDFPYNENSKIKISLIELNPNKNIFNKREDFFTYAIELNEKSIMDKIIVQTKDTKKNTIEFRIQPKYYIVEGNWQLKIK